MFAGYQGVHTAFKPGAYSMTLNSRGSGRHFSQQGKYFDIISEIYQGRKEIGFFARDCLMANQDFESIKNEFSRTYTISPIYLIMAGPEHNQGLVMSKSSKGPDDITYMNERDWYLLQTNNDHYKGSCHTRC